MRLSIIIPTLDEEKTLEATLEQALRIGDQVCVSDGGSSDSSLSIARNLGVDVVEGPAGRGGQLNRGAAATDGDTLLFLHADTRLPDNARLLIQAALEEGGPGGGFHARYDSGPRGLQSLGNWLIRRRTAWTRSPLGDQCQFVRRDVFDKLGGFQDWPILEDLDFIRRLKREGSVSLLDPPVITSARRFESQGVLRTTATNWLIWGLYFSGTRPEKLAELYRRIR